MTGATYKCENCGGTFENEAGWTEEAATAEFNSLFPKAEKSDAATLCDDCWRACMAWARETGALE